VYRRKHGRDRPPELVRRQVELNRRQLDREIESRDLARTVAAYRRATF
jgi:hypothetical protein